MEFNKYQTPLTDEVLAPLPQEVKDQLFDVINNVEFIRRLISPNRQYAKDRPRDDKGRIIIDLANPHIVENVDYFRPSAIHYQKYGCYTNLKPNSNPNSDYGKWIREERRRCWEGYIRPSDGEWVTGYMYWFLNYCPIMLSRIIKGTKRANRVEDFPEFWEGIYWRFHYMEQAANGGLYNNFEGGQHCAELASRSKGKAHPYNEIVYTPEGKKLWGDIKIGDLLYSENGNVTKVIDIPFDDIAPIYEIEFSNGEKVRCSEGHLWEVENKDKTLVLSTAEILSKFKTSRDYDSNYIILNNKGVEFNERPTAIDPYIFGLLLGNSSSLNNSEEDLKSEYKFIPEAYRLNSKKIRINLLKGLLDSKGVVINGRIELSLTSKKLIDDVKWILSSLGISYTKERIKHTFYYNNDRNKAPYKGTYKLSIFSNIELFNLNKKLNLWKNSIPSNHEQYKYRGIEIVNIRYIGEKKAKCVTVDNPTHKYLIGNFITTHNSFSLASILSHDFILGVNEIAHNKVMSAVTAYQKEYLTKDGVLNKFISMVNFCAEHTQFPRRRLKSSMQDMTWIMGYKDVEMDIERGTLNTILGVSSKDDESKLRGKRAAHILIEEFGTFPRLIDMYNVLTPSVEEGDIVYGQIYSLGTSGDSESDFAGAQEINNIVSLHSNM